MNDSVNNPSHYTDGNIEVIEYIDRRIKELLEVEAND